MSRCSAAESFNAGLRSPNPPITIALIEDNVSNIRITQLDGALPNIALMKLAHWHKAQGDHVHVTRQIERNALRTL